MSRKQFSIQISREKLERFLFDDKARINHIEFDHATQTVNLFLEGAGPDVAECQMAPILDVERALQALRRCLKTQD